MDDDSNLNSLFENLNMISANEITQRRVGGGTGGGAQMFEGNMDPNPLIGLNPYLSENVTSFRHGGKHKKAYYKHGGKAQYSDLHDLSQQEYDRAVQGGMNRYNVGGSYLQQANQSIQASRQANEQQALGQISALVANSLQKRMSPEQATNIASQMAVGSGLVNQPIAKKGMKMPKYDQGGATHTMPDGTVHPGATHEDYMAMMSGANSLYMANKGMRMKKRYTQGGRF